MKTKSFEFEVSGGAVLKGTYPLALEGKIKRVSFELGYMIEGEICLGTEIGMLIGFVE